MAFLRASPEHAILMAYCMAIANDGENLYPTTKDTITTYYFTYCFDDVFYSHILLQVDFNALSYEVTDYK